MDRFWKKILKLSGPLFLWTMMPGTAHAHMQVKGSALFSGLLQPLTHPEGILGLLSLALWSGRACRGCPGRLRHGVIGISVGILGGMLLGANELPWIVPAVLGIALFLALLTAADRPGPPMAAMIALPLGGVLLGWMWREGQVLDAVTLTFFAAGIATTAAVLQAIAMGAAALPQGKIACVAVRVAASWMAAVCAMLLAFILRPGP